MKAGARKRKRQHLARWQAKRAMQRRQALVIARLRDAPPPSTVRLPSDVSAYVAGKMNVDEDTAYELLFMRRRGR